ncbi:MAG TPA: MBL fold metallo-hydrolase [Bacillus bacterium]|nr:MBL fold metallo-hydrolase [Bacillus sp. (in: firmicutes)]
MSVMPITAKEINDYIMEKKALFILDVRNEDDFHDWKIEGSSITHLNVPYYLLIDDVSKYIHELPKDEKVAVVCAQEGSAKYVAELLAENGFNVAFLEGGMKSWSEYIYQTSVYEDEKMRIYQFVRVGKGCLSYMVISGEQAIVIEPLRFIQMYIDLAEKEAVKITHIFDSHLHADHISGGQELAEKCKAKFYLMKSEGAVFNFEHLENYEKIDVENVRIEVLAVKTPGHTPGSVSFLVNDAILFSGDTIFVNGLGRPDLGGKVREWAKDLYNTVYEKVSQIADNVIVLPAHYADFSSEVNEKGYIGSTLGNIRKQNEIMQGQTEETFVEQVAKSAATTTPPNFENILAVNKGIKKASDDEMSEFEIGPNRCAVHHTS